MGPGLQVCKPYQRTIQNACTIEKEAAKSYFFSGPLRRKQGFYQTN